MDLVYILIALILLVGVFFLFTKKSDREELPPPRPERPSKRPKAKVRSTRPAADRTEPEDQKQGDELQKRKPDAAKPSGTEAAQRGDRSTDESAEEIEAEVAAPSGVEPSAPPP
ncbi:MAG TPA: hypothetical protein VFQ61_02530, partial [Polyangiaceae bacterium]|nr:hypothetical protein [Polyangiaceae bacterium]